MVQEFCVTPQRLSLTQKKVLIIFYSYTQQTRLLVKSMAEGLEQTGVGVSLQRLEPVEPYEFPFQNSWRLALVMMLTFFRRRNPVMEPDPCCYGDWDRIVLAGPTWSYHPSGPVLSFLDTFGLGVLRGKKVIPFISCRSYYRLHIWSLKRMLAKCGAVVEKEIVFDHPGREPWRFIGLLYQLRGRVGSREQSWLRKHYPGYGHSREQRREALEMGRRLGLEISGDDSGH